MFFILDSTSTSVGYCLRVFCVSPSAGLGFGFKDGHALSLRIRLEQRRSKKPTQIYPKANLAFSSYFIACCPCYLA
ncbi:hypothetical protein [Moraxella lacunata]|uniref:hypothetical protein n=1 Tax=Moraxella lacunata TaxID=477 RepID=UPI003EDF76E2